MKATRFPHTYVIIFLIIVVASVLTWIVPGGEFERKEVKVDGIAREVIQPDSFRCVTQVKRGRLCQLAVSGP